jgi:hypothetical protein
MQDDRDCRDYGATKQSGTYAACRLYLRTQHMREAEDRQEANDRLIEVGTHMMQYGY